VHGGEHLVTSAKAAVATVWTLAAFVFWSVSVADAEAIQIPLGPTSLAPCSGDPIAPTQTVEGSFPSSLQGSYVMVPFDVPSGTTQVRVRYCWEGGGNVVDLGLWQARGADPGWGESEFRGWGGSSHPDVAVSRQGFSTEEQYLANPKGYIPGRTTRGFLPGPIPAGEWAVELGVGAALTPAEGNADGLTDFRVEIELSSDPAFEADPYAPADYDETPARAESGWYAGDLHGFDVRGLAMAVGGTAMHWRGGAPEGRFHPLPPALVEIHKRLKRSFDPEGIFNPGRLLPEL